MPEFFTTQEIADILKIKEKTVRGYILQGRLSAISLTGDSEVVKRGPRTLRVSKEALNDFIKKRSVSN